MNRYPRFHSSRGHRRARRKQSASEFGVQVAGAALVMGLLAWNTTPAINAAWTLSRASPEEMDRVERSVYYPDCRAARAAGAAPIERGSPGYRSALDRDDDGTACEPYR